jgi:hypothetical protein
MKTLLASVSIVLLVLVPSCKFFKGGKSRKKADIETQWKASQDSIRVADSIRKAQDRLMAFENARLDSIRNSDQDRQAWASKYKYNIIVGSFITPAYARDLEAEYQKKGYDARILKVQGSRFELVSAEAHESFRKAVTRLKEFQDTIVVDAWLYINKK